MYFLSNSCYPAESSFAIVVNEFRHSLPAQSSNARTNIAIGHDRVLPKRLTKEEASISQAVQFIDDVNLSRFQNTMTPHEGSRVVDCSIEQFLVG